ncbi:MULTISPECIES: LuxR C-terminal-related transcriptional regulator [unclassified Frankia]|uniref:LuxR C-terminal-related transcriptional regulator n=1 Tax=unclassified Frankia TaxID=2632575 RepID=UPI001EFFEA7A|nr:MULTISPECIES: LuxR C-terminal-related transcriptional regulator [unclassified Frankia]
MQVEVRDRQRELVSALRAVAGASVPACADGPAAALVARLDRLAAESADAELRAALGAGRFDRIGDLFAELGAVRSELCAWAVEGPFQALTRIRDQLALLRRETSSGRITRAAPAALCAAGGFDRAMISSLRGSTWLPVALHVETKVDGPANEALRRFLTDAEIPLASSMPETELVRRRAPALIRQAQSDGRVFRPLIEISGTREYVAAPIVAGGCVLGFLHADTYASGRRLTDADRDHLQTFADGLGLILERTVLLERSRLQHDRIADALRAVRATSEVLGTAPVQLARTITQRRAVVAGRSSPSPSAMIAAAPPLPDGLTPREREVLRLLAAGATNAQIANALTVSETTVKSHVKHILRKLRASNRAEAIARYLYLARTADRAL